jgi:ATP-dependent DNA ligase
MIYPPRPSSKVPPSMLPALERRGIYVAQRKFNGDRCLVHVHGKKVQLYNRHGKLQKYKMPDFLRLEILALNLNASEEYWLDGELMHARIPDTIILFDVLQAGEYLYGKNLIKRLDLLREICNNPTCHAEPAIAVLSRPHIWMAETFLKGFAARFKDFLHLDTIEGLVLKEGASLLDNWGSRPYEVDWQVRCRKPGPNYQF